MIHLQLTAMKSVSVGIVAWSTFFLGAELLFPLVALATPEAVETGRLLAVLLDSGRVTIEEARSLIEDPNKGDKGYTAPVFETQLIKQFKDRTKINLTDLKNENIPKLAKKLLPALVDAMKQTVDDYQPVINRQGMGFKGFFPDTFGAHAAAKFRVKTGMYLKQTMISPRNRSNAPDEFEAKVLREFSNPMFPRQGDMIVSDAMDSDKIVRVMLPLFYRKSCLLCHGEPKGGKDITGYMKEGAMEGDMGGAISVKLTLK